MVEAIDDISVQDLNMAYYNVIKESISIDLSDDLRQFTQATSRYMKRLAKTKLLKTIDQELQSLDTCEYSFEKFTAIVTRIQALVDRLSLHRYSHLLQWVEQLDRKVEKKLASRLEAVLQHYIKVDIPKLEIQQLVEHPPSEAEMAKMIDDIFMSMEAAVCVRHIKIQGSADLAEPQCYKNFETMLTHCSLRLFCALKKHISDVELLKNQKGKIPLKEFLKQVSKEWEIYKLDLVDYKSTCNVIRGWDDLFAKVKEF